MLSTSTRPLTKTLSQHKMLELVWITELLRINPGYIEKMEICRPTTASMGYPISDDRAIKAIKAARMGSDQHFKMRAISVG